MSVKKTSMLPRSSIATSRLTITFFSARRFAPVERLTVTIAGSSCGVRPIEIESAKGVDSITERPSAMLTIRIVPASTPATRTSSREKSRRPIWNAVCGCCSPSCLAILPNAVRPPVCTTTPTPFPERTTVPMNAHERRSSGESGFVVGSTFLSAGADSPVSTPSSHSSSFASSSRRSAGTTSPTPRRTTSPGTSAVTSTEPSLPSRNTIVVCRSCECRAATARAERYSLTNPRPTLSPLIRKMISASVRSPRNTDATAVTSSKIRNGLRNWLTKTVTARTLWLRSAFGPTRASRRAASALESPSASESRLRSTSPVGSAAAAARSSCCDGGRCASTACVTPVVNLFRRASRCRDGVNRLRQLENLV